MGKFIDKQLLSIGDGENKLSLFALTLPLFFESIGAHLMGVVQTMMAARYHGGMFVIPVSVASSVITLINMLLMIIPTGLSILLSLEIGRKNRESCKKVIGVSLIVGFIVSIIAAIIGVVFAEPLLIFMGMDKPDYAPYMQDAVTYLKIRSLGFLVQIFISVLYTAMRCYGHTVQSFIGSFASNVVNAIGTAVVIFWIKVPESSGAVALAIVPFIASAVNLVLGVKFFRDKRIAMTFKFSWEWTKKIFSIGVPASISSISYNLSQAVAAIICLSLTPSAYLAKNYISQIVCFVYVFGYSIGQANAIIIGRLCGMNEPDLADKMQRQNLRIVVCINITLAVLFAAFGKGLVTMIFAADESVALYAALIMWIDVLVEIGRGMNHIGQFGLNATGDVKFTTVVSIVSCWVCSIGLSYIFVVLFKWDLYGMWIAFAIDELLRGFLYLIRWKKQSWRKNIAVN